MTANSWGKVDKSTAPGRWSEDRVVREIRAAVQGVAKAAGCTVRSMDIDVITPPERAEATAKAAEYDRLAGVVFDPADRENYQLLAKAERQKAGPR
jgi:hypothetical protein